MSQKSMSSPHNVPFFPPGIARHKVVSTLPNIKDFGSKKPQSVKECKMMSKPKMNSMTSSVTSSKDRQSNLRRFSNSTPNLKVCQMPGHEHSFHKHNCDMGLSPYMDFKAKPLPAYYASDYLEKPFSTSTNEKFKTRSLDRLSSVNKSRNLTGFVPDRPFYPPSQYPNIHDKINTDVRRLIDTRDRYKTPESRRSIRKISRRQSTSNIEKGIGNRSETPQTDKQNLSNSKKFGSVPHLRERKETQNPGKKETANARMKLDLNVKPIGKPNEKSEEKQKPRLNDASKTNGNVKRNADSKKESDKKKNIETKTKSVPKKQDFYTDFYQDPFVRESEIGPYRHSNKLDLESSDAFDRNHSNDMYTSYFYPRPIPNQRVPSGIDRMAQSLIQERSVASMIFTGSLDRANQNYPFQQPTEVTDPEESPTKSMSAPKRVNSFSQDSLDGNKSRKKPQKSERIHQGGHHDEMSGNSEPEQSSTMSQIEEDEFKAHESRTNHLPNNLWNGVPKKEEMDQYNIDQLMTPGDTRKDLSPFPNSGRSSPISIHNEFISNPEYSIIGKDDRTLLNDLASKCRVSTDRDHPQINFSEHNVPKNPHFQNVSCTSGQNDPALLESIASKCFPSTESRRFERVIPEDTFTKVTQMKSENEIERNGRQDMGQGKERGRNQIDLNNNFGEIKRPHSPYDGRHVGTVQEDIPRKTLDFSKGRDLISIRIEEHKESNNDLKDNQYKNVLITNDNFSKSPKVHNVRHCEHTSENNHDLGWKKSTDCIHPEEKRPRSPYQGDSGNNIDFDQNLCQITMTDENLTGIKNPHDHKTNEVLLKENEYKTCPTILNEVKNKTAIENNFTKVEPISKPSKQPSSLNYSGFTEKKFEQDLGKNFRPNENTTFDRNGERITITYENLTGIKPVDEENHNMYPRGKDGRERSGIIMGTDQYCNQIFISGRNYSMVQRVLSPIDGEYSMVKDMLLNEQPSHLPTERTPYFEPSKMNDPNSVRQPLKYDNYNDLKQTGRTFLSSLNAQHDEHEYNGHRTTNIPNIEIEGDGDITESSSTNELSWSDCEGNRSCMDYVDNSMAMRGIPWRSSPELHSARCTYAGYSGRHLQSENPLKPLCSICHKPAYFMERISISNIIFHKSCFRCRKCDTHLNFNNCIIYRNRPYCVVHMRSKVRRSVRSASSKKLNQIKERLDNKSNLQKQSSNEPKHQKRIFYEGINSAKTKFLDDATKIKESPIREQKRITPPRQGFNSGVVESDPKPRDPNILGYSDSQTNYLDEVNQLTQNSSTRENRARIKELQEKGNGSKEHLNGDEDGSGRRSDMISVDTKSLRNRFIANANDSDVKLKKINPSDEIRRLSEQESNSIYENEPENRTDVAKADFLKEEEALSPISRTRAKEMKERFTNFAQNDQPRKTEVKLEYGEGGVYESNPQEKNDDVVKYNYDTTVYLPENTVKSGLQRIKDLQDQKSQGYQKTNKEPITVETDPSLCGIYENTPEKSRADSISYQNNAALLEFKEKNYTNEAKKVLLEKQKQEELEASSKKSPPNMIDIWKDLCQDSGIFENQPKEQRKDVVKHDSEKYELVVQNDGDNINGKEEISTKEDIEENNVQKGN